GRRFSQCDRVTRGQARGNHHQGWGGTVIMKRSILPLAVFGLVIVLPLRADAPALEKAADKPVTVPFELLKTGHMAIMVKINGKGPYKVIFDTGAPVSQINNK